MNFEDFPASAFVAFTKFAPLPVVVSSVVLTNGCLLKAFPDARFIIATHSPLIVGSVKNSHIYALKYNDESKIESNKLDFDKQPKTASEILDEALGVSFTMPIWAEKALVAIVDKYSNKNMTKDDFGLMRSDLADIGMERLMPSVICDIVGGEND